MSEATINDLKQFISETVSTIVTDIVSEQISSVRKEFQSVYYELGTVKREIHRLDQKIDSKIDSLFVFIADAMEAVNDTNDLQFKNHELRLQLLEYESKHAEYR